MMVARDRRRPAVRLDRAGRRRPAHVHPRRRAAAGGAGLQLCAPARGRSALHLRHGQARRPRRLHSAIVLAMIALLIGYEAVSRFFAPVPIHFARSDTDRCLGLAVNVASAWLLSGGRTWPHPSPSPRASHHEHHDHAHDHDEAHRIVTTAGVLLLSVFEDGVPPVFRLRAEAEPLPAASAVTVETVRPDGTRQTFRHAGSRRLAGERRSIPEPHAFVAQHARRRARTIPSSSRSMATSDDHVHSAADRDNNMRAAVIHVAGRRGGFRAGHRRAGAGPRLRLALDGPARRHRRAPA